jgi:hypothetical protein
VEKMHKVVGAIIFYKMRVLTLSDVLKNPAFNVYAPHTLRIHALFPSQEIARANLREYLIRQPWPPLNKTSHINHYCRIRCEQTGQEFRNAAEAAKLLGINAAQLSQHLRRMPGYKSIKGMTFSTVGYVTNEKAVIYPVRGGE